MNTQPRLLTIGLIMDKNIIQIQTFYSIALGITLLLSSSGRYVTLLTIRSVLRTASRRSA